MNKKNNETTLTHLTKRFVKLLNSNSERVINLNEASTRLSVAKRRIYDITNVLEGIGLLQKTSKNVTRWVDCPRDSPFAAPKPTLQQPQQAINNATTNANHNNNSPMATPNSHTTTTNNHNGNSDITVDIKPLSTTAPGLNLTALPDAELLALLKTYQTLEEGVNDLESTIRQQLSADGAYVTYHDIKSSFNDQTVIAVKAPPETRLEVNEHLQIAIKSEHGQIEVYLYQHSNNNQNQAAQQQLQNVYQTNSSNNNNNNNTSPHLQQSQQPSNSSNSQPLDPTFTNTNNLIGQPQQAQPYTSVSSDEGRGRSTISTTDGIYYDPTSGVSDTDHYYNDPTLSSALSGTISEDEDPFKPLVPFEGREEPHYNFVLDENYTITSLFPEDNLGLY